MQNILFMDRKTVSKAEVKKLSEHTIQIITDAAVNTSGFHLLNASGFVYGKYEDYTTLFREIEGGFILSNDGSIYIGSEPMPKPETEEPTLEEIKESKVNEMNDAQQKIIQNGINVTLSDGTEEHFTLTDHDQTSLMGLQVKASAGQEQIPWHTSDETEHCKFYSNEDMALITSAAMDYVTWHVTYFRDLRIYIRALQTREEVESVTYGMEIPEYYQSEPLKAMIAAQKL